VSYIDDVKALQRFAGTAQDGEFGWFNAGGTWPRRIPTSIAPAT